MASVYFKILNCKTTRRDSRGSKGQFFKPQVYSLQEAITKYNEREGTNFTLDDVKYYKKDEN